jgi:methylated-DNA-[protein]-cysteine S-methyltransferase
MTQNRERAVVDTAFGPFAIEAEDQQLLSVRFVGRDAELTNAEEAPSSPVLRQAVRQLDEYFVGSRKRFELPYQLSGTDFQKSVWQAIAAIDFGSQRCYGDIAAQLGNRKLARAVGQAAGRNPLLVVIPCHRLVGSGGKLGGFAAGIGLKKNLLEHERGVVRLGE